MAWRHENENNGLIATAIVPIEALLISKLFAQNADITHRDIHSKFREVDLDIF